MAKTKKAAEHYFEALKAYEGLRLTEPEFDPIKGEKVRSTLVNAIRDARVFDVPHDLFTELVYLTEDTALHEWGCERGFTAGEANEVLASYLPDFPGPLPFPNMFIAVTPSVEIVGSAAYFRIPQEWMLEEPYVDEPVGFILGYLLSEEGLVSEISAIVSDPQTRILRTRVTTFNGRFLIKTGLLEDSEFDHMDRSNGWMGFVTLVPWVITELVEIINSYVSTVTDWGMMMAAGVVITLPALAFFVMVQRYLIAGWGAGAVKG